MPKYDFSVQLTHRRTKRPFTTSSVGLNISGLWTEPSDYDKPIKAGTLFELLLLYTVDRRAQQRPAPGNVLSEEEKRDRARLATKVGENPDDLELESRDVELLKLCISVLSTEPNVVCHEFLDAPKT